ncbi:MAG: phosphoribosyltransferase family protein, partial [Acidobacteriota bacterium]
LDRGYNQAALLSRPLARLLALPHSEAALARTKRTTAQVGLSTGERMRNLRGAFRCPRPDLVRGRRILLVDDVITTGATVSIAAGALLAEGAVRVSVLTLARTVSGLE